MPNDFPFSLFDFASLFVAAASSCVLQCRSILQHGRLSVPIQLQTRLLGSSVQDATVRQLASLLPVRGRWVKKDREIAQLVTATQQLVTASQQHLTTVLQQLASSQQHNAAHLATALQHNAAHLATALQNNASKDAHLAAKDVQLTTLQQQLAIFTTQLAAQQQPFSPTSSSPLPGPLPLSKGFLFFFLSLLLPFLLSHQLFFFFCLSFTNFSSLLHPFRRDYNKVGDQPASRFGSLGVGDGQFHGPYSVACNSRGEVVVEELNQRIQVFDRNGKFMFKFGTEGKANGQLDSPCGVTIDQRNDQIVVTDACNHGVQSFDVKGSFLRVWV